MIYFVMYVLGMLVGMPLGASIYRLGFQRGYNRHED